MENEGLCLETRAPKQETTRVGITKVANGYIVDAGMHRQIANTLEEALSLVRKSFGG